MMLAPQEHNSSSFEVINSKFSYIIKGTGDIFQAQKHHLKQIKVSVFFYRKINNFLLRILFSSDKRKWEQSLLYTIYMYIKIEMVLLS